MYVATAPVALVGQVVGTGQCVAYVQTACKAPLTKDWRKGELVKGSWSIPIGAAIATFDPDGTYGNHTDGRSHAAVYAGQDTTGIWVWDQWTGQEVHSRRIRFASGGTPVNDGNCFFVVEGPEVSSST